MGKIKPNYTKSIIAVSLLVATVLFSVFVMIHVGCKITEPEQKDVPVLSSVVIDCQVNLQSNLILEKNTVKSHQNIGYILLLIMFGIVFVVVVICLTLIIINDDGSIKFAKLNELHSLFKFIKQSPRVDVVSLKNKTTNCKEVEHADDARKKEKNIEEVKEEYLIKDILETYMHTITEI